MTQVALHSGETERLETFVRRAKSGTPVTLKVSVYSTIVKQLAQSESTDDISVESDMNLWLADFTPEGGRGAADRVTKVYAVSPLNEIETKAKTTRHVVNERLKMDYARLKAAGVQFEAKFF